MTASEYTYRLALETPEGRPLGVPMELAGLDDEPAREWGRFQHFLLHGPAVPPPVSVLPRWDERKGEPVVAGLRVVCGGGEHTVPRHFFEPAARDYSRRLLAEGVLRNGDLYRYVVTAAQGVSEQPAPGGLCIDVVEEPTPWRYRPVDPRGLVEEPLAIVGEHLAAAADVPVFMPEQVLEEASAQALANPAVETGGVLIGSVCRDPASGRSGVVIGAQLAATETEAGQAHLTFTSRTWAAVNSALARRGDGSLIVGWWHSHPAEQWCDADCSEEARARCHLKRSFFSEMDVGVHRAVFCQGYSVALVLTITDLGIRPALYGWREGMVQRRAFHITGCRAPLGRYATPPQAAGASQEGCSATTKPTTHTR